ncbi:hypothetical protein HY572_03025 [Candidatus Micrarchaeota archaeon]|nr:hypothetical protein [Candidatus Micrarchaeota archaeon]
MGKFTVQGAFDVSNRGVLFVGQVQEGPVLVGQEVELEGVKHKVAGIEKKHEMVSQAGTGDMVGIWFEGFNNKNAFGRGQILVLA